VKKVATYLLVLLGLSLFVSCKKDDAPQPSKVRVFSPVANASFEVFDTIEIKLLVESPQSEIALRISLLDENHSPASPLNPLVFSNFKTNTEATVYFILDHEYLESGNYYLFFNVSDQSGNVYSYRSIYVGGIERQFEGFFIVSEVSDNQLGIEKLNNDLTGQGIKVLPGNYAGSAIDSRYRNVSLAGQNFGNLIVLSTDSLKIIWEVPIIPNPVQPYFTFLQQINQSLFAGFYNGEVNVYNPSGDLVFSTQANGLTFPNQVCIAGNMLEVSSTSRSNAFEHWLETYFMATGASNSKTKLSINPMHLKSLDDKKVLVFGNDENSGIQTKLFDPGTGLVINPYQPFPLPDEQLICAVDINNNKTLLGLEGGIYIYEYQNGIALVTGSISPLIIQWEDISQTILVADISGFIVLSANGQLISQNDYPYPIYNILLQYNK
jgi:hypothetical protein